MDRVLQRNVLAMSGRAVEAAGDVDVLLLDKTGTITLGNRMAVAFHRRARRERTGPGRVRATRSLADETPEGRSIVVLAKEKFGLRAREMHELEATFVPFTAQTRMSGVDLARQRRAADQSHSQRRGAKRCAALSNQPAALFPQPVGRRRSMKFRAAAALRSSSLRT